MEKEKILQEIGLSENEAKIYLALLKLGQSLVSKIVIETRINRTHIYDRLNKLLEKGIVSYAIKSGKKYFRAISPEKLLEKLEEKEKEFRNILPELFMIKKKEVDIDIEVYKSKEGLKTLLNDILKEKKDVFILGFTGSVAKELEFFYPHFQKQRAKLGIKRKIIADYKIKKPLLSKETLTKYKFIPEKYQSPSGMWVYGNKTVIFLPEKELYMILIKSKKVAQLYRNYFNILWKSAKE